MIEYWELRFKNEGAMWKYEPSDSAITAMDLFKLNKINKILIPGCGYGRNTKIFYENGFEITGIEISKSAIEIAKENGLNCKFHHGSVISMPFDNEIYDGIFCYALIHLLNKNERREFIQSCYNQLRAGGLMIFVVASKEMSLYGSGRLISKDRYEISKGLKVYFYDNIGVAKEFLDFGMVECKEVEEPIKYMDVQEPIKLIQVMCKKI